MALVERLPVETGRRGLVGASIRIYPGHKGNPCTNADGTGLRGQQAVREHDCRAGGQDKCSGSFAFIGILIVDALSPL